MAKMIGKQFTLDGNPVEIIDFLAANAEEFTARDIRSISKLRKDGEIMYGGGAGAEFILKRVK